MHIFNVSIKTLLGLKNVSEKAWEVLGAAYSKYTRKMT
jgi:hypothetical protein